MTGRIVMLCVLFLPGAVLRGQDAFGYRYRRPIEVAKPGWVRVPLGGFTQSHAQGREDWNVLDPVDSLVPVAVLSPQLGRLKVKTLSAQEVADGSGHQLVFDLGMTPVRHRALTVRLQRTISARCKLEGSQDGTQWVSVGKGDFFRLGGEEGLQQSRLEYEPVEFRYLRLFWPESAGFPRFREVTVETVDRPAGGKAVFPLPIERAPAAAGRCAYFLRVPVPHLPILFVELGVHRNDEGACLLGYSLSRLEGPAWRRVSQSVVAIPEGKAETRIRADLKVLQEEALLVRLFPEEGRNARLAEAKAYLQPRWVLFFAKRPGTYTLRYGGQGRGRRFRARVDVSKATGPVVELLAGAEEDSGQRTPPPEVLRPGRPSREPSRFIAYSVVNEDLNPGDIVRLELPDEVLAELFGPPPSTLRLRTDGRDLPFLLWSPDVPAPALAVEGLEATPLDGDRGISRVKVKLPETMPLLNGIEILSDASVEERRIDVSLERARRPGVEGYRRMVHSQRWVCLERGDPPLVPCRLACALPPSNERWERLVLTFHDGSRGSLKNLRLVLWRKRKAISFAWPPSAGVELLLVGGRRYRGGTSSLEPYREQLMALPWKNARLDVEEALQGERDAERARRIWLTVALAIVALVLLGILARSFGQKGSPPKP